MEELNEILLRLAEQVSKCTRTRTHTGSIMSRVSSYIIPLNSVRLFPLSHTSVNRRKERERGGGKRFDGRWRWKIFITGCACIRAVSFDLIWHSFLLSPRCSSSFWTSGQARRHGFRYLSNVSRCKTHSFIHSFDRSLARSPARLYKTNPDDEKRYHYRHLVRIKKLSSTCQNAVPISNSPASMNRSARRSQIM